LIFAASPRLLIFHCYFRHLFRHIHFILIFTRRLFLFILPSWFWLIRLQFRWFLFIYFLYDHYLRAYNTITYNIDTTCSWCYCLFFELYHTLYRVSNKIDATQYNDHLRRRNLAPLQLTFQSHRPYSTRNEPSTTVKRTSGQLDSHAIYRFEPPGPDYRYEISGLLTLAHTPHSIITYHHKATLITSAASLRFASYRDSHNVTLLK
jgi:hypothetical protein